MKRIILIILILLTIITGLLFALYFLSNRNASDTNDSGTKTPIARIGENTFRLELAKTEEEKQIGLSSKDSLPDDMGMLFVFDNPGIYSFWMKNMSFAIDIIYIKDNKIVTIHKNVPPPADSNQSLPIYNPTEPADKVLEINAGLSEQLNIKEGDSVVFENL